MVFVIDSLEAIQGFRKNSRPEQRVVANVAVQLPFGPGFTLASFADHVDDFDEPATFDIAEAVHFSRPGEADQHLDEIIRQHGIGDSQVDMKRVLGQGRKQTSERIFAGDEWNHRLLLRKQSVAAGRGTVQTGCPVPCPLATETANSG